MISLRNLTISISLAVLSAVPFVCAQEAKPSEAELVLQLPLVIQQLELQPQRSFDFLLPPSTVSAASTHPQDLSRYREFQFGMNLLEVAKQADVKPADVRVVHQRPALIQELEWRPQRPLGPSSEADPVKEVLFSFYDGELFRLMVDYDQYKTEGMTDADMVEAISSRYGIATKPAAKVILFSSFHVYNDSEKVIARWEDSQYSVNLFRSSYQPTFGLLVFSKQLDARAVAAVAEAMRLDDQEAPQREIDRQKKQDEENRAAQDRARPANKANFRP
jgi:hypothetical protein